MPELAWAIDELAQVAPSHQRRVIEACAATLSADRKVTAVEAEPFRATPRRWTCRCPHCSRARR
ncbi:MAG: hypothetical protein KJZ65_12110 [Phycisphaerales bacterium]|nr:hypothetical protein [Phycisphaerales bacterium]